MTARARRTAVALALLCAALPAATAGAQEPPPFPGVGGPSPGFTPPPLLTPFPGTVGPTIQQFDCHTYWIRSSTPPFRVEQQTVCFGWKIVP
jgi:hypothetical protein